MRERKGRGEEVKRVGAKRSIGDRVGERGCQCQFLTFLFFSV